MKRRRFLQAGVASLAALAASHAAAQFPAAISSAIGHRAQRATTSPTVDTIIVCDGNSLTFGAGSTGGNTYPAQLYTALGGGSTRGIEPGPSGARGNGNPTNTVLNFGVSGQTSANMIADASQQIDVPWYNATAYPRRRILVCGEGTNDIANSGLTAAQAWASLQSYCRARLAAGWYVIACTTLTWSGANETTRGDYNNLIKAGTVGVDFSAYCDWDTAGVVGGDYVDVYHLNNTGYGKLAALLAPQIAALL